MNKREKAIVDKEIELYRREAQLKIEENMFERKVNNWEPIDKARVENYSKQAEIKIETARLEAKKVALAEVLAIKDTEISLLKGLLEKAIAALQTIKMAA